MAKYLIRCCNRRYEYVTKYLVPSMITQGIKEDNIKVYLDVNNEGCLESCMKAFSSVPDDDEGTWHLQDDIIISSDFRICTEKYNDGIVCGYCWEKDRYKEVSGFVDADHMWYSFPCIRIPNKIARGCAKWYYDFVINSNEYHIWVNAKKYDDSVFDIYVKDYCRGTVMILNLEPNIVDHIDYLIGGSVINYMRSEVQTRAAHFEDKYLVDKLAEILKNNS